MTEVLQLTSNLYLALAEIFSSVGGRSIPSWMHLPGPQWPIYPSLQILATNKSASFFDYALEQLSNVTQKSDLQLQHEYSDLFSGQGGSFIWLHESYYMNGRIPGPATFTVKNLYQRAGVETAGAELPDHASIEMAFLAFLVEEEINAPENADKWLNARKLFIKNHASKWLPGVGEKLVHTENPTWMAVGYLLQAVTRIEPKRIIGVKKQAGIPQLLVKENCSLCGFCKQVCPTDAIYIVEDSYTTELWLEREACISCGKCIPICPEKVLEMTGAIGSNEKEILRKSARAKCAKCGQPVVSEAELAAVGSKIGHPAWLYDCLDCRTTYNY